MKLNIDFEHDAETGKERAVITDDRGDRMPGVRGVDIKYRYRDQATIAVIELVVNRSDVTLGHPIKPAAQVEAPEEGALYVNCAVKDGTPQKSQAEAASCPVTSASSD